MSSGVVFNTCNKNKAIARDKFFGELSEYERVVKEWDRDAPKFRLGNFTVFKEKLSELNNSTVYVTPYDDRTTDFTFYYERSNVYWRAHGFL